MRPIKFRAWEKKDKRMFNIGDINEFIWDDNHYDWNIGKNCILMQFTGLFDNNGKEIYEKDVVKLYEDCGEHPTGNCVVKFEEGSWALFWCENNEWVTPLSQECFNNRVEAIGNIYENPELMERSHED